MILVTQYRKIWHKFEVTEEGAKNDKKNIMNFRSDKDPHA